MKEQQQRSVQTKLDSSFKSALLRSKRSATCEVYIDDKVHVLLLSKRLTVMFFYLF
jgi:hypothetical protein